MNLKDVKKFAEQKGVRPGRLKKVELIRSIQSAESNPACYMTDQVDNCKEASCLWRADCR